MTRGCKAVTRGRKTVTRGRKAVTRGRTVHLAWLVLTRSEPVVRPGPSTPVRRDGEDFSRSDVVLRSAVTTTRWHPDPGRPTKED